MLSRWRRVRTLGSLGGSRPLRLTLPVGGLVLLLHGFDRQLTAIRVDGVEHAPVPPDPHAVDGFGPFPPGGAPGPRVFPQIEDRLHDREEGRVVIDIEQLFLGPAADPKPHPALAFLSRARRASISRTGKAWAGCRRRPRTSV